FGHAALRQYLLIGAAMVLPMVLLGLLRNVVNGFQQYRFLLVLNLLASPLWVIGCVAAIASGAAVTGVLLATLVVDLLQLAAVGHWVLTNVGVSWRAQLPEGLRGRLMRYNATLAVLIVLNAIVWERSELLFLGRFH